MAKERLLPVSINLSRGAMVYDLSFLTLGVCYAISFRSILVASFVLAHFITVELYSRFLLSGLLFYLFVALLCLLKNFLHEAEFLLRSRYCTSIHETSPVVCISLPAVGVSVGTWLPLNRQTACVPEMWFCSLLMHQIFLISLTSGSLCH
jgi:hypothetical protein